MHSMCEFCMGKTGKGTEIGKDYPVRPCANGDLGVRAQYLDGGIVLYRDRNTASGYFDINYCPICGRRISKETNSEPVSVQKVLEDMYNPDGGLVALAARDYYYQNYASEEERKSMDREDKVHIAIAIIFMIVFWVAVGFAVISSLI